MYLKLTGSLGLSGVFSGIDTDTLVAGMMLPKQAAINSLQDRQDTWEQKNRALTAIEGALTDLKAAADDIRDVENLSVTSASSSDVDVLLAKVTGDAGEGSHEIVVNRLATSEREVHEGVASLDTLVGSGTFSYTYNGQTQSIQTNDETTLADLRDLINNDASNPGVTASVLEYDAGGGKVYHLVLGGRDSGADYGIVVTGTPASFTNVFDQTQTAQDSQIRVDGYPSGDWIERSTNVIEDVLPGVRLTLRDTGTVSVAITRSTGQVKTKLNAIVSTYNALVDVVEAYTGYDEELETSGVLLGDMTVHRILGDARLPVLQQVRGFLDETDTFTHLSEIGLEFDQEGKLELDEDTLDDAIATDYAAVLDLVSADHTGASDNSAIQFNAATDDTEPGTFDVNVTFDGEGQITAATIQHSSDPEPIGMSWVGNVLTGDEGTPAEGLELTVTYGGEAEETATVRVRQGFGGRLYDVLYEALDETTGFIGLRKEQNEATITSLQKRIEREEDRLEQTEQRLKARFARLEAILAQFDSQRASIEAMIQGLSSLQQANS